MFTQETAEAMGRMFSKPSLTHPTPALQGIHIGNTEIIYIVTS